MPSAWNLTRKETWYRHEVFSAGLKAARFQVRADEPRGEPSNALLIWNRYGGTHEIASRFEAAGGTVIVGENGYLGIGGQSPHSMQHRDPYAIAIGHHNDERAVPAGDAGRWAALGIDVQPWRQDGGHVLVCPNRSFGEPGRIMPVDWVTQTVSALRRFTKREIRVRSHPGNNAPRKPLVDDLDGAHCTVIWHSSAGVHSLIAGVPVICLGPRWIMKSATGSSLSEIENPPMPDRMPALHRLAAGQFFLKEIEDGSAFRRVLGL